MWAKIWLETRFFGKGKEGKVLFSRNVKPGMFELGMAPRGTVAIDM